MFDRLRRAAQSHLPAVQFAVDSSFWVASVPYAVWVRYDFDASHIGTGTLWVVLAAIALQAIVGTALGLYRASRRYGTFDEVLIVAATAVIVGLVLTVAFWRNTGAPRSVPLLAMGFTLLGQVAARSIWRLYKARRNRQSSDEVERTIVVGAGEGAEQILRTIRDTPQDRFHPVALLDDDRSKRNLRLSNVRVRGQLDDLAEVAKHYDADAVLIAIPSAGPDLIRRVTTLAEGLGLHVYILPPLEQLLGGVNAADIRPVQHADLLGRRPAEISTEEIAGYVTGRRVLVTGAGGSIGSELCRQLVKFEPSELLMLDRDESGLHSTQLSIEGRALLDSPNLILADIRDAERVAEVFEMCRPDVVFHTAALKHLPLLETHPAEAWKTNVCGTLNLIRAAAGQNVSRFVNVSTDKAANPTSVLGWTKRITERMTSWANQLGDTVFVSVRFGNVLGSNGSVLKAFEAQAANGGPITVTHPEITRYFMTTEEASRLTIHAGAIGAPGEVMILDMGEPVKIVEVAKHFAAQHDPPLEIVFTGLRPNEKMHEDLVSPGELGEARHHPLITHVGAAALAPTAEMAGGPPPSVDVMIEIALRPATIEVSA